LELGSGAPSLAAVSDLEVAVYGAQHRCQRSVQSSDVGGIRCGVVVASTVMHQIWLSAIALNLDFSSCGFGFSVVAFGPKHEAAPAGQTQSQKQGEYPC